MVKEKVREGFSSLIYANTSTGVGHAASSNNISNLHDLFTSR